MTTYPTRLPSDTALSMTMPVIVPRNTFETTILVDDTPLFTTVDTSVCLYSYPGVPRTIPRSRFGVAGRGIHPHHGPIA